MNYKIGQILYLLEGGRKITPVKIEEIVVRQRSTGEEHFAFVLTPNSKDKDDLVNVEDILNGNGKVYMDINQLKKDMLQNAENIINQLANNALEYVQNAYGVSQKTSNKTNIPELPQVENNTPLKKKELIGRVQLPDGSEAKVQM